jgi:hypothetical protein
MRFKDKESAVEALEAWKRLRGKVETNGGENYDKPVLVQFLDTNTFEVMDRDIVEDEFYVLRKYRILRDLDAAGRDLEEAIRNARGGKGKPQDRSRRPQKSQRSQKGQRGDKSQKSPKSEKSDKGQGSGPRRRRRRRGPRRGGKPPSP